MGAVGLLETFLVLVRFADFPLLVDGLWADLSLALLAERVAEGFLTGFFLPAAFFLAAAFFADMALASKTVRKEPAIIQTLRSSGRGWAHPISGGKATGSAGFQPGLRCSATTVV